MILLTIYILVAILFSFACSIFEAVILSTNNAFIAMKENEGHPSGTILKSLKEDISKPLAAILTLNTIAHTIGAAGAGAQAAAVFGNAYVGIISAVLTLLILIFSEIIPKTLGATFWRQLAPLTAYSLKYLIIMLYPFVKLSDLITGKLNNEPTLNGFSREEFAVMAEISNQDGQLLEQESVFLKNLMRLHHSKVKDAMTPRTVVFTLSDTVTVEEFFHRYDQITFTRIPIYHQDNENITGYVFRSDLLLAQARGNGSQTLENYCHKLPALLPESPLSLALNQMLEQRVHMILIVNEYGGVEGIITMEDVMETMLGFEIVDEKDKAIDMQKEALKRWQKKAKDGQITKW
ncbi:CNNM domain-containing protein [Aliikangiella sp. G2MR2-5]|uniref:CNNM domain-containing protein n=1 Tax=Aliikangiella sp. G2MR2-5 TaxID=2788943 RepID=UPI0018A98C5D|nr:CNNM domain-containing protein [Aliikangiella sp. G2MR2-5]